MKNLKEKQVKLCVDYSDGYREYLLDAKWQNGIIKSLFGNEILSKTGAWFTKGIDGDGFIYFNNDNEILFEHTLGHVSLTIKDFITLQDIKNIIDKHYFIADRIKELETHDIECEEIAMGSGGVGQVQYKSTLKQIRMQIGYGHGKHNYAQVAILPASIYLQEFQAIKKKNNRTAGGGYLI